MCQCVKAHTELPRNGQHARETGISHLAFLEHVHCIFAHANTAR
jgi:hypothetical protein